MTTLLLDKVKKEAKAVSRLIREAYPDLKIQYIVHHTDQRAEAILIDEDALLSHSAGLAARDLLSQPVKTDYSQFIGLSCASKFRWLLLRREESLLGIITFNADQYNSLKDAQVDMFHHAWHAINMRMIRERPENIEKYRNRPILPKRNPVNQARANLMADSFSAIFLKLMGEKAAIKRLAKKRADDTLKMRHKHQPELYPFPIAMEASQFAYNALKKEKLTTAEKIMQAYKTSINIGKMFNAIDIHQWWGYAQPAQDMAWRQIDKLEILSAAVHTSDDPFIRSNGDLIAEILGIDSSITVDLTRKYNAFDEWEKTRETHEKLIHETFEIVIAQSIKDGSSKPLLKEANEQNSKLRHGDIFGWCAAALQAAAKRFDGTATLDETMLKVAAETEFRSIQDKSDLDSLKRLGAQVVDKKRHGKPMSLKQIEDICAKDEGLGFVSSSIAQTRNDPSYLKSFEVENVFTADLAPKTPAPEAPTPSVAPVMAPMAPGLGTSRPVQQTTKAPKERQEDGKNKGSEERAQ